MVVFCISVVVFPLECREFVGFENGLTVWEFGVIFFGGTNLLMMPQNVQVKPGVGPHS